MAYRISELEIPSDDPFRYDVLGRRPLVEFLAEFIGRAGGPFVLALDSPWGSGKTTPVKMLMAQLQRAQFQCIYFNAWRVDHAIDPLVALVASVDNVQLAGGASEAKFRKHVKTLKKVTSIVAKRGAVATAKVLTAGALDIGKEIEDAAAQMSGDVVGDIVGAFRKETELLNKFRMELEAAVALLPSAEKKPTLVWFIDELDRCRPTFAIALLERVKHLFDVPNVIFVLSIDKQQLEAITSAVYGLAIKAPEYLRRFIDLELSVPVVEGAAFTESLLQRFELAAVFEKRTGAELRYDKRTFVEAFTAVADLFGLSLRARERCFTRMTLVLDQTPLDHYLDPILVALLLVLRSNAPDAFNDLRSGVIGSTDVMKIIAKQPGGNKFCADRAGIVMEAYLLAGDQNEKRVAARYSELDQVSKSDTVEAERARQLLELRKHVPGFMRSGFRLKSVADKIDLAASLK